MLKFGIDPDYILLLNNDIVVERDFLKELVKAAEKDGVRIAGPKIYFYDFNGRSDVIQSAGGKINLKKVQARILARVKLM